MLSPVLVPISSLGPEPSSYFSSELLPEGLSEVWLFSRSLSQTCDSSQQILKTLWHQKHSKVEANPLSCRSSLDQSQPHPQKLHIHRKLSAPDRTYTSEEWALNHVALICQKLYGVSASAAQNQSMERLDRPGKKNILSYGDLPYTFPWDAERYWEH